MSRVGNCCSFLIVAAMGTFFGAPASAALVTFQLENHPDGTLFVAGTTGPYGIRADDIGEVFSVADNITGGLGGPVFLSWDPDLLASDPASATATITGTVERDSDGALFTVDYILRDLVEMNIGDLVGFIARGTTTSIGSINDGGSPIYSWTGLPNGASEVFAFIADGDRLGNFPAYPANTYVGRGWLTGDGTNDFLVTATLVPLPAALWLLISGLGVFAAARRRQTH